MCGKIFTTIKKNRLFNGTNDFKSDILNHIDK